MFDLAGREGGCITISACRYCSAGEGSFRRVRGSFVSGCFFRGRKHVNFYNSVFTWNLRLGQWPCGMRNSIDSSEEFNDMEWNRNIYISCTVGATCWTWILAYEVFWLSDWAGRGVQFAYTSNSAWIWKRSGLSTSAHE